MSSSAGHTTDVFHRGRFVLVQPSKGAHRAGMDALVLAACVPTGFRGTVMDFGAGAGAVGLAVASRCQEASVVLVERSPEMARCAADSIGQPANSRMASRLSLLVADIALTGIARGEAGLNDRSADFIVMNPPFNDRRDRATPNDLRREAHVADDALFESWLRSAGAVLRPRGFVALIARASSLEPILAALNGRFGGAEIIPVHARQNAAAIRIVVRAQRGSRGLPSILPPLVLHDEDGGFTDRAEALLAGEASLFGD